MFIPNYRIALRTIYRSLLVTNLALCVGLTLSNSAAAQSAEDFFVAQAQAVLPYSDGESTCTSDDAVSGVSGDQEIEETIDVSIPCKKCEEAKLLCAVLGGVGQCVFKRPSGGNLYTPSCRLICTIMGGGNSH